ncbi:MAG TPA: SDR family NAD(P)-dependent oxidoreductase [Acidobacteriota bacterium]|nr:SDR family NAD(P)-dependent oxidoreductase [Acidobacteriota bacterium]
MPSARKVVLVTGATGGLGRAVVKRLLASGADVAAAIRDDKRFQDLIAFAGGSRETLTGFMADVTSEADVREMIEGVLRRYGRIDALVNLVGAYRGGADIAGTTEADWDFLMRTNLKSVFLCSRAVLPAMVRAGAGRIVNVAARPAVETKGRARAGAYAVSKAGVVVLTAAISEEFRRSGITANCIVPGTIDTPENRAAITGGDPSQWAAPGDVAEVIAFLVSDGSSVASGAVIPVYGKS